MIDLKNRKIFEDGTVLCNDSAVFELLYSGQNLNSVVAEPSNDIKLHNLADRLLDTNYGEISTAENQLYKDVNWFEYWITPEPFNEIDVETFIKSKCKNRVELERVEQEFVLFKERNMLPVLRHLLYLVEYWRSQNILWGVGRGSSVSSFVLYLIGINRINPLDYNLEIEEFLK